MRALLAAVPLAVVACAMLARRSSRVSAALGLVALIPILIWGFPLNSTELVALARDWAPVATEVVLVVGGGIMFAEAGRQTGHQEVVSRWITRALGTGILPVLAIVHGFTPLTESLTGYGIGAALAVPLLLGIGLSGRVAATVGLLGLCAVPWGSLGPGTLIAAHLTGVSVDQLGVATAWFNGTVFLGAGVAAALLVCPAGTRLRGVAAGLASGGALWAAVWGANTLLGTAPAGALGGLCVLSAHLGLRAVRGQRIRISGAVLRALVPYAVVLGGVLTATSVVSMTGTAETLAAGVLTSPALWLCAATATELASRPRLLRAVWRAGSGTWVRVAPATVLFILLGALMGASGMSEALAEQLAALGTSFLFVLPFCAALIGLVTGSNSGANALGAGAQADVARALGADATLAVGAHNAAGAAAMMASPARVELATRLARVPAEASRVQRTLLLVLGGMVAPMAVLSLWTLSG
ncbi:L-lactate permease [Leucobacter chromiireducens]|uniref:L-lactate permease n=1 Tax=Leucobacter chromiireducens subsp. solipictus TaxID=398235 RepID=A0ABS1SIP6_9MICO|nr:L-lactate permease [Leucobacter chromiireducens subsp. solipictus]